MSTRINSTRRIRMISNPENDAVVQQTPISLDEDDEINKLEAELKAKKEAREKNKQSKRFDEIFNKIKELPRTEELMAQLEALVHIITPVEAVVNEPIELVVNEPVANTNKIRLENMPDRLVLVANSRNQTNKIIYNKSDKKFYRYDQANQTCYKTLNQAYTSLFPGLKANAWERFHAREIRGNGKCAIETIGNIKWLVNNSDKYCDKDFVFTL